MLQIHTTADTAYILLKWLHGGSHAESSCRGRNKGLHHFGEVKSHVFTYERLQQAHGGNPYMILRRALKHAKTLKIKKGKWVMIVILSVTENKTLHLPPKWHNLGNCVTPFPLPAP